MRFRTRTWALLSVVLFIAAIFFWRFEQERRAAEPRPTTVQRATANSVAQPAQAPASAPIIFPANILATATNSAPVNSSDKTASKKTFRLHNTTATAGELSRNPTAVLLRNAFIDTAAAKPVSIPEHLRASADPGSYIVQARGIVTEPFREELKAAKATIVSYVPNNAYLVRVSAEGAKKLADHPLTQSVLPYEPYFKLDPALLDSAVKGKPLASGDRLRVVLFAGGEDCAREIIASLNARLLGGERTPFGPALIVQPIGNSTQVINALAQSSCVQNIEPVYERVLANDLTRVRLGISPDPFTNTANHLGLTGTNIYVNVNDSCVDTNHPDLKGRVFVGPLTASTDVDGHGTHVAGIIAATGENGPFPATNAIGSALGSSFRGMAHQANIFSLAVTNFTDVELQELAARSNYYVFNRTNVLISNNSWGYRGDFSYDSPSASFDQAVRDALPDQTGSQPMLFVFAAGNAGSGNEAGSGGDPDSITSPSTAKNVITVGALEAPRKITNLVVRPIFFGSTNIVTNADFYGSTDSSNQVRWSSSRGNVGYGIEGDFGRFKPDVVAPGTFIVSTRSGQWDTNSYYHPTNVDASILTNVVLTPNGTNYFSIFVPPNAVGFGAFVLPNNNTPTPIPPLAIFTNLDFFPTPSLSGGNFAGTNSFFLQPGDPNFTRDAVWYYDIVNTNTASIDFDLVTFVLTTNDFGNFFDVLRDLNEGLAGTNPPPKYRYESGTSMAAPAISGMLALMQQYFAQQTTGVTNPSASLLKALLINSARSAGPSYELRTKAPINYQGWGLPNLVRALPTTNFSEAPLLVFDQSPTNALATDERETRVINVDTNASAYPLRFTLVWTDPPGNPAVGVKLVNDLDLIVTNLDSGEIYFGNNFPGGSDFSSVNGDVDTNGVVTIFDDEHDVVNNVENVYINGPVGSKYAVTVLGRRVNVNAVTAQTNGIKQDYALVISSGNTALTNVLSMTNTVLVANISPKVQAFTNFDSGLAGERASMGVLLNQRVGANFPMTWSPVTRQTNGTLSQWNFYKFTNTFGFTNVAFAVFGGIDMSGQAASDYPVPNVRNVEADLDLYVSRDPLLFSLDPITIDVATDKSVERGGDEIIIYDGNAPAVSNSVYYIGVKSEDQRAGEFSILAIASEAPFSDVVNGNVIPRFFPKPALIEDGSPQDPGKTEIYGIITQSGRVRRLTVTNSITHELYGDLFGVVHKSGKDKFAVLNNHRSLDVNGTTPAFYNDIDEGDTPNATRTDGPGKLSDFMGIQARGLWMFTVVDNALLHTGQVDTVGIFIDPESDTFFANNGSEIVSGQICRTVYANNKRYDFVDVSPLATNLAVEVSIPGGTGPIEVYVRAGDLPTLTTYDKKAVISPVFGVLNLGLGDSPPLIPGESYYIMLYNPTSSDIVQACWRTRQQLATGNAYANVFSSTNSASLVDDAVVNSSITITTNALVGDLQVGLRIDHPRISDLSIRLVSPNGTKVLLFENRGGLDGNGMGVNLAPATNSVTNLNSSFETAPAANYSEPSIVEGWNVLSGLSGNTNFGNVTVANDPTVANTGSQYLDLRRAGIERILPTVTGASYQLSYAYRSEVIGGGNSLNPVSWWKGEYNATDSIDGNNGILTNGISFAPGFVGQAFNFDGVDDHVYIPQATNLNVRSFTMDAWIYPRDISTSRPLFEFSNPTGLAGVHFWISHRSGAVQPGTLYGNIRDTSYVNHFVATTNNVVQANQWQHVALTYDASTGVAALYRNGIVITNVSLGTNFVIQTATPLQLGLRPPTSAEAGFPPFIGKMDEPAIYNFALSASQIQAIYAAGAAGKCGTPTPPSTCPGFDGNFVSGGSFELPGSTVGIKPALTSFDGWTVSAGSVNVVSNSTYQVASGSQALDMSGAAGQAGVITQNVPTKAGQQYVLNFARAGNPDGGPAAKQTRVYWNSNLLATVNFDTTGFSRANMGWTYTNYLVTATSNVTELRFESVISSGFGMFLDDVSVTLPASALVTVSNVLTTNITASPVWQTNKISFVSTTTGTPFKLEGLGTTNEVLTTNSFEAAFATNYSAGSNIEGWTTVSSNIALVTEPLFTDSGAGTNVLSINCLPGSTNTILGTITRTPTLASGGNYLLNFRYRRAHSSLIAWWKADGNTTDIIGGNNGAFFNGAPAYVAGKVGNAFSFDGTGRHIEVPDASALNPTNAISMDMWVYVTGGQGTERDILSKDGETFERQYIVTASSLNRFRAHIGVPSSAALVSKIHYVDGTTPVVLNTWYHVAETYDGTTLKLYVNGNLDAQLSVPGPIITTPQPVRIGGGAPAFETQYYFPGYIDEVGIHNRAISAAEIRSIYLAGSAGRFDSSNPPTNSPPPSVDIVVNGSTIGQLSVNDTNWHTFTTNFTASSASTPVSIVGKTNGLWIDSVQLAGPPAGPNVLLDSITLLGQQVVTNYAYVTFTENTNVAPELIKFALPPFSANCPAITNLGTVSNSWETASSGVYAVGTSAENWFVTSSNVAVVSDPPFARLGTNVFSINCVPNSTNGILGVATRSIPTTPGKLYVLSFAQRRAYSSLTNWWPADNSTNDVVGGQNSVLVNGTTYVAGEVGQAFSFDGVDDYVNFGTNAGNFGTNDFTVDFWMKTSSTRFQEAVIGKRPVCDGSSGWDIRIGGPGVGVGKLNLCLLESVASPNVSCIVGTNIVNDGVWHHIAARREGTNAALYVDGVLDAFGTSPGIVVMSNAAPLTAGTEACVPVDGTQFYTGQLDEIGIHNRAISVDEIRSLYLARSAGRRDSSNPPYLFPAATADVVVNGSVNSVVGGLSWSTFTSSFLATSSNATVSIVGVTNGLWIDSLSLDEVTLPCGFYLPEETLSLLTGQNAQGTWALEIWDNRTGAVLTNVLVSWDLQMTLVNPSTASSAAQLGNGVPLTSNVISNQMKYFVVQVPSTARYATNSLVSLTGGTLDLFYNSNSLPTGSLPGDVQLLTSTTSGTRTLNTNGSPPLQPGQRYYLGVRNSNPAQTNTIFQITVQFDTTNNSFISTTGLKNGVAQSASIPPGFGLQYFHFDVLSNDSVVVFEILQPSGNADLVVRRGEPLPTARDNDYAAVNPGSSNELIPIAADSPVPPSPSRWYLGVLNRDATPVYYAVRATEQFAVPPTNIITLANGIPFNWTAGPGVSMTNFFRFVITQTNSAVLFEVYNLSGNGDLIVRRGTLPDIAGFDFRSGNSGVDGEQIVLRANDLGTDLNGEWLLGVPNNDPFDIGYTIRATLSSNGLLISGNPPRLNGAPAITGNGNLQFHWNSVSGERYQIQASTDFVTWTVLDTVNAPGSVTSYVTAGRVSDMPYRFFRVNQVP